MAWIQGVWVGSGNRFQRKRQKRKEKLFAEDPHCFRCRCPLVLDRWEAKRTGIQQAHMLRTIPKRLSCYDCMTRRT